MKPNVLLCLYCLAPWPKRLPSNRACPRCGVIGDALQRERLSLFAYESARFGFEYRSRFERQLGATGEIRVYYCLTPTEHALVAAALTVLKACAARLSYDVIKNRMIAAWSAYRKKSKRRKKKTRESDGVQPDQFIKSVQEYAKGLRNVNPVIQRAIREEIRAEATTSVIMEALKNARLRRTRNAKFRPTEEKAQVKILAKALRAAMAERTKDKVTINAFKGLESISAGGKAKRSSKSSGLRTKKRDKNS